MNIGFDEFGSGVPTVDFAYPDDGEFATPAVRDQWREAPLMTKCQQCFAVVPSNDVLTMPLLDKRLEVLRYALREAVEQMDFGVIHRLVGKARSTMERIVAERLAATTPGSRERIGDVVLHDDAGRGKVVIHFAGLLDLRERRWLRICGFSGCGDGATYWRKRKFLRGENMALDRARHCVQHLLEMRAQLAAREHAEFVREIAHPLCA